MLPTLLNHLNPLKNFLIYRFACKVPLTIVASAGGYFHLCVRELGIRENPWHRVGVGWSDMALQHRHVLSARLPQVHHPVHTEWQGLGQPLREQGIVFFALLVLGLITVKRKKNQQT